MDFRTNLSLTEELRQHEGTYLLTWEFFNVQAQCSRIRGYAEVAPEAVAAAADAIYKRLEDAITYIEKSFSYFLFLTLWRHGKTFNEQAWNEFIKAPAPMVPPGGKV